MKSIQEQLALSAEHFLKSMETVSKLLKRNYTLEDGVNKEEWSEINFEVDRIPFTLVWEEYERPVIGGAYTVPRFTLYVWKETLGTYFAPPESEDIKLMENIDINQILHHVFYTVAKVEIDGAFQSTAYEEMAEEHRNEEQM